MKLQRNYTRPLIQVKLPIRNWGYQLENWHLQLTIRFNSCNIHSHCVASATVTIIVTITNHNHGTRFVVDINLPRCDGMSVSIEDTLHFFFFCLSKRVLLPTLCCPIMSDFRGLQARILGEQYFHNVRQVANVMAVATIQLRRLMSNQE